MSAHTRQSTADLIKGFAVIFMIQVHIMGLFAQQQIYDGLFGSISLFLGGPFVAPAFVTLMGYYLAYTSRSTSYLVFRGCKLLILGLLLNTGLNFHLLLKIYEGTININHWQYIFGIDILVFAGISIIIIALIRTFCQRNSLFYLILACVVIMITPYLTNKIGTQATLQYVFAGIAGTYSWSYFPLFPWLAYPLTGYGFSLLYQTYLQNRITPRIKLLVILFTGISLGFNLGYAVRISSILPSYYHHNLWFYVWTVGLLAFWGALISLLETDIGETLLFTYIKWLGKHVTLVYVIQWLLIGNIATTIYKTQTLSQLVLWYGLLLTAVSLLTFLWLKAKGEMKTFAFLISHP